MVLVFYFFLVQSWKIEYSKTQKCPWPWIPTHSPSFSGDRAFNQGDPGHSGGTHHFGAPDNNTNDSINTTSRKAPATIERQAAKNKERDSGSQVLSDTAGECGRGWKVPILGCSQTQLRSEKLQTCAIELPCWCSVAKSCPTLQPPWLKHICFRHVTGKVGLKDVKCLLISSKPRFWNPSVCYCLSACKWKVGVEKASPLGLLIT